MPLRVKQPSTHHRRIAVPRLSVYPAGSHANWAPLRLDDSLIERLQQWTIALVKPTIETGDSVRITAGGFAELDAIFVAMEGEQRVILLLNMLNMLNMLNRQQRISVPLMSIIKN